MSQRLRVVITSVIFFSAASMQLWAPAPGLAAQSVHEGEIEKNRLDSGLSAGTHKVLQGGVKEANPLEPSVHLIPGVPKDSKIFNGHADRPGLDAGAGLTQFKGNVCIPAAPNDAPYTVLSGTRSGVIPPISSYTLLPRTRVLQADPAFSITPVSSGKGVSTYAPGFEATNSTVSRQSSTPGTMSQVDVPVASKGVTVYVPELGVGSLQPAAAIGSGGGLPREDFPALSYHGVTSWTPGYDIIKKVKAPDTIQAPTSNARGISTYVPGTDLSISSSHDGVVCWSPGYEVSVTAHSVVENKLGGLWTARDYHPQALQAVPKKLMPQTLLTVPTALTAQAFLLPELRTSVVSNWDDWYQRVAGAIYSGWQNQQVGPGVATMRVTVTRTRQLSCQVEDFTPAADIERNADAETIFREAALRAVHLVNKFEIPDFPNNASESSVSFDVQMRRLVGGKPGVDVASVHEATNKAGH
jgi:hypothetical protein